MILDRESGNSSVISKDLTVEGNLVSKGDVIVEGEIKGNVNCVNLSITAVGQVTGDVTCKEFELDGTAKGVVTADRIDLKDGSTLEGDLVGESLSIEHGATFIGSAKPKKGLRKPDIKAAAE